MLEHSLYSFPQFGFEVVEYQMRMYFWHCFKLLLHIVTEHHILQTKVESWTDWKMTYNQSIRLSPVLV